MSKLKVAVIGCGKMGMQHLRAISSSRYSEIIAISDPQTNAEKIRGCVGKNVELFSSASELFSKTNPDAVHIVTPPASHYEVGKMALENGAHVFIEKPFVLETWQAEELVQIAKSRGLKLFAGHQLLAQTATQKAEELVKNIGDVVHVESYFSFRKVKRSLSTVDQAIDIMPHPTYTLLHFLRNKSEQGIRFVIKALETQSDGEIRAIIEHGGRKGFLVVSLKGRPVDSYLKIVGTNGSVYIDYVRGVVINLSGAGADAVSAIITPYRQGWQHLWKTTISFAGLAIKKDKGYDGLSELFDNFYACILSKEKPLVTPYSIIETVKICETIAAELRNKERISEERSKDIIEITAKRLPSVNTADRILVTGGNGFLGSVICNELRNAGRRVKALSRSLPRFSERLPGIEYEAVDLADEIPAIALEGVSAVIHCAAETSGGMDEHKRNSVEATRKVFEAAAAAGIKKFIHMSSIAILKPGRNSSMPLNENSPVDIGNPSRGPYVWGKAQSEEMVADLSRRLGVTSKIMRLGPLVDFDNFQAPGRLGREVGSYFVVMGSKKSRLSICDVHTVAKVICYYLNNYDSTPSILNLVEPGALTRQDLIGRLCEKRKDLRALYIPSFVVSGLSAVLYAVQKAISPSRKPLDIAAAFASETYNTELASEILTKTSPD